MPRQMQKNNVTEKVQPKETEITESKEVKKEKKTFSQSDGVLCRSITQGSLYFEGIKTGMLYSFSDYGDETEIEYRDLVGAIRSKDKAVFEPRFVVEDEDFILEYPALKKFYDDEFSIQDIKGILNLTEKKMIEEIEKLPIGAKNSLKTIAAEQVYTGQLDSVRKIKALDSVFKTDLNLIGELFSGN